MEIEDDMTRVVIGGVTFVPYDGAFLRLYPLTGDVSAAIKRNVLLLTDSKTSGYGMESQTTAVSTIMGIEGASKYYLFEDNKDVPYRMSETASLFKDGSFMPINKRNCQRVFPNAKDKIDAYFKDHKNAPSDIGEVIALCKEWAQ